MKDDARRQFLYTAAGAALGTGGVLRFPSLCQSYGGAFVAAYAVVLAIVALPLLRAELTAGRRRADAFPLAALCPLGGAAGGLAAVNSAAMCACYIAVTSLFAVRACTFYAYAGYGCPADIVGAPPVIAVLVAIALAFFLTRSVRTRSAAARIAVLLQGGLTAVLAVRGLAEGGVARFAAVFAFEPSALASPGLWLSALGQALLSLSLAAGVMPSLAPSMPRRLSSVRAAASIVGANFAGGLLAAAALLPLAGGFQGDGGALENAFVLCPVAIAAAFCDVRVRGLFGSLYYASLTLTSFVSALSLARPAFVWACRAPLSRRSAAFMLSALLCALGMPFAMGASFDAADGLCCNVVAPVCAALEGACFLYYALTTAKRGGKIDLWKILNT